MNNKIILVISFVLAIVLTQSACLLFKPKTIGADAAKELTHSIDSLTQQEVIHGLTKNAIEGALSGTTSEESDDDIKKLSETLTRELSKLIQNIDTGTPGSKFSKGVTENLLSKEVEKQLTEFVTTAINSADGDIALAIKNIEDNLSSSLDGVFKNLKSNISGLEYAIMSAMSKKLKDSLSFFITDALNGIAFDSLSANISTDLLSDQLRDTLTQIVVDIQNKISEGDGNIFDKMKDYFIYGALFVFVLILGLLWYYFHRRMRERTNYENDLSDIIENIVGDNDALKEKFLKSLEDKNHLHTFQQNKESRGKQNPT